MMQSGIIFSFHLGIKCLLISRQSDPSFGYIEIVKFPSRNRVALEFKRDGLCFTTVSLITTCFHLGIERLWSAIYLILQDIGRVVKYFSRVFMVDFRVADTPRIGQLKTPPTENVTFSVSGLLRFWDNFPALPSFFPVKQQKTRGSHISQSRQVACCLTILIYFIMFKGATSPRYTYIPRL